MGKPLFRWTMGHVEYSGYEICVESVLRARSYWGDEVDYVVVCNNVDRHWFRWLGENLGFSILRWADVGSLPHKPYGYGWKYYPPRLRLDSHELFIDNDLIFLRRSEYVDRFLASDCTLYNEDIGRGFAEFEGLIRDILPEYKIGVNGGLIGFPPGYDIRVKLMEVCGGWGHTLSLSEQGLTAYLLLSYANRIGIPMPLVYNANYKDMKLGTYGGRYAWDVFKDQDFMGGLEGFHYIGANRERHIAWEYYKSRRKRGGMIKL